MQPGLMVGVLLEGETLPAWQVRMLQLVLESGVAQLVPVVHPIGAGPAAYPSGRPGWLQDAFTRLDAHLFHTQPDAQALLPVQSLFPLDTCRQQEAGELDVLVVCRPGQVDAGLVARTRLGAWSLHFGDENLRASEPAGMLEVLRGQDIISSQLVMRSHRHDSPQTLCRSFSRVEKRSVGRSINGVLWKSAAFLVRALQDLQAMGEEAFLSRVANRHDPDQGVVTQSGKAGIFPGLSMALLLGRFVARNLVDWVTKRLFMDQWVVMYGQGEGRMLDLPRFRITHPPRTVFQADPFVLFHDGTHHIFFEEWVNSRKLGHISVMQVLPDGSVSESKPALVRPYHLSYPFVFGHEGMLYMIPETKSRSTVELYRCTRFPDVWEHCRNLMEGVDLVDSTVFRHDGRWWLFANRVVVPGSSSMDELFLYHTEDLFGGKWIPHPSNPVVSDVRRSRPAGKVYMESGRLIRPAQDSSKNYGYGIRLNEIEVLTELEYREREIEFLEPVRDRRIRALHTINHDGGVTVIDGLVRRCRYF